MVEKLWIEQYRPKTFNEFVGQDNIKEEIESMIKNRSIPHLLFEGPAGVGKTTMCYIVARQLFGDSFRSNFLELNASDERGIDTIRQKVKTFAKVKPLSADFKIIFLDEADHLTNDAQASLRRVMELYSSVTRFILSCNYKHKIISPIQSRCKVYKFNKLEVEQMKTVLHKIVPEIEEEVIAEIVKNCDGDMRRAINELQAISSLDVIDIKNVRMAEGNFAKEIMEEIKEGSFMKARMWIDKMLKSGWNERRILIELRNYIIKDEKILVDEEGGGSFLSNSLLELMKADERLLWGVDKDLVFDGLIINCLKGCKG